LRETFLAPARLTSLSRNKKVGKDRHTAHHDYDDQSDNDGVKLWVSVFVHDKMILTWIAGSYLEAARASILSFSFYFFFSMQISFTFSSEQTGEPRNGKPICPQCARRSTTAHIS
jgi:hypothetical protein